MPFNPVYTAGGTIDQLKKLPHPLFPSKVTPFTKGVRLEIPASPGEYEAIYQPTVDMEFSGIKFASSGYADRDYWELIIGSETLFETIYTKELPEALQTHPSGLVYPVPAETSVRFVFYNESATSKTIWIELSFLK